MLENNRLKCTSPSPKFEKIAILAPYEEKNEKFERKN